MAGDRLTDVKRLLAKTVPSLIMSQRLVAAPAMPIQENE
jgi:hypothetical protein